MKSALFTEALFYKLLQVPAITELIDGKIFKGTRPAGRKNEDIVLGCLTHNCSRGLCSGLFNVNIYCPSLGAGAPNYKMLEAILDKAAPILEKGVIEGMYYKTENISSVFTDKENPLINYINLRMSYQIR